MVNMARNKECLFVPEDDHDPSFCKSSCTDQMIVYEDTLIGCTSSDLVSLKENRPASSTCIFPLLYTLKRLQVVMNSAEYPPFNLKAKQVSCLDNLLVGREVIAVLPTGFGKSLLFHALSDLCPLKKSGLNNILIR